MLNHENVPAVLEKSVTSDKTKRKANIKKLALFGVGSVVLIIGIVIFIIMIIGSGSINYVNISMGISFSYPKGWEIIDETGVMVSLYDEKLESEIHIIDITDQIVYNISDGDDINKAAERAVEFFAEDIAGESIILDNRYDINVYENSNKSEILVSGKGYFTFGSEDGVNKADLVVGRYEGRIFACMLVNPLDKSLKNYDKIINTLEIDPGFESIEEKIAQYRAGTYYD